MVSASDVVADSGRLNLSSCLRILSFSSASCFMRSFISLAWSASFSPSRFSKLAFASFCFAMLFFWAGFFVGFCGAPMAGGSAIIGAATSE